MNNNLSFNYTYSAKEQAEIKAIRDKYVSQDKIEDKMTKLRKLDASVTQKATAFSLVIGIIGALVLGFGMSLIMTDLCILISISEDISMILGVVIGVIGLILTSIAYPIYNCIINREREKIAPQIIKITDELMK